MLIDDVSAFIAEIIVFVSYKPFHIVLSLSPCPPLFGGPEASF